MLDGVMLLWFLVCGDIADYRSDRHPRHTRSPSAETGVRAADCLHRSFRRFPPRARLPGTTPRTARTLHRSALAAKAGINHTFRRGHGVGVLAGAVSASILGLAEPADGSSSRFSASLSVE